MSSRRSIGYSILSWIVPQTLTSSTDATPIVATKTAHWYVTWDRVLITGHATNIAANWTWTITKVTADTFSLDWSVWSWAWAWANWIMLIAPKVIYVDDFRNIKFDVHTTGSANCTLKVVWSLWKTLTDATTPPNFWAVQSSTNSYDFMEIVTIHDWAYVDWTVWIVPTWTDIHRMYEVNTNWLEWFTIYPTAWSAWTLNIKCRLYDNK